METFKKILNAGCVICLAVLIIKGNIGFAVAGLLMAIASLAATILERKE